MPTNVSDGGFALGVNQRVEITDEYPPTMILYTLGVVEGDGTLLLVEVRVTEGGVETEVIVLEVVVVVVVVGVALPGRH